ncbi:O-antigen polymerase [Flavobacterium branchiicola]|uniref:O-antigen polymerase n=1 Tax=Flavobacterium branchiicola TaxID=1114875 RepID=A0ABV9PIW5_9FLAO|nr:O-antigen polymerase [Flavobacterium branchiicola]MBS7255457.1 oligosaccharide repeat unit polymerase [Flavobacterium branchiicola]
MNYVDFFLFAEQNLGSVIFFALFISVVYFFLHRKYIYSFFDPFLLITIISGLSASTVFFLYFNDAISAELFYRFIFTELAFFAGFFIIRPIKYKSIYQNKNPVSSSIFSEKFVSILFYISSFLHIGFQLLTYIVVGIPLLLESRMSTFAGGSGFGLIGRIIEIVNVMGTFLLLYRVFYCSGISVIGRLYNYLYLFLVIIFLLLSGSKTNLIFLVYYLFFLNLYMLKIKGNSVAGVVKKISKFQKILIYSSIPLIFVVMYVQLVNSGSESEDSLLLSLGQRVISFGDIYYMTFPDNVIRIMNNDSGLLQLFKDPLGMLRIVSWEKLPLDCGIEIYQYHYPNGMLSGPNARYNYFAILYFNTIGQIIYCFILGLITSFMRNTFFKLLPNNIIFGGIYTLFAINLVYIYQDQAFTVARFFNIITIVPILIIFALFIQYILELNPLKDLIISRKNIQKL